MHIFICSFSSLEGEISNYPTSEVKHKIIRNYQKNPSYNLKSHSTLSKNWLFIHNLQTSSQVRNKRNIELQLAEKPTAFSKAGEKQNKTKQNLFINIFGSQLIQMLHEASAETKHFCAQSRENLH